jgi:hypothetical protein
MFYVVQKYIEVMEATKPMEALKRPKTWGKKIHMEKEADVDQSGLIKYICSHARWCCGSGRHVLRSTIKDHFRRFGHHYFCANLIVVRSICSSTSIS